MTAPFTLTYTCSGTRNGQHDDCEQVQLPCSLACILTFAPTPAIHGLFAPLQDQQCHKNGMIAPPLFAAPVGARLASGDARCQHSRQRASPPNRPNRQGIKPMCASASSHLPDAGKAGTLGGCAEGRGAGKCFKGRQLTGTPVPARSAHTCCMSHIACVCPGVRGPGLRWAGVRRGAGAVLRRSAPLLRAHRCVCRPVWGWVVSTLRHACSLVSPK